MTDAISPSNSAWRAYMKTPQFVHALGGVETDSAAHAITSISSAFQVGWIMGTRMDADEAALKALVLRLTELLHEQWVLAQKYQKTALKLAHKALRESGIEEELSEL